MSFVFPDQGFTRRALRVFQLLIRCVAFPIGPHCLQRSHLICGKTKPPLKSFASTWGSRTYRVAHQTLLRTLFRAQLTHFEPLRACAVPTIVAPCRMCMLCHDNQAAHAPDRQCLRCGQPLVLPSFSRHVGEGCHLEGHIVVNRVAGNFHIALTHEEHTTLMAVFKDRDGLNVSHEIHSVSFGEAGPPSLASTSSLSRGHVRIPWDRCMTFRLGRIIQAIRIRGS